MRKIGDWWRRRERGSEMNVGYKRSSLRIFTTNACKVAHRFRFTSCVCTYIYPLNVRRRNPATRNVISRDLSIVLGYAIVSERERERELPALVRVYLLGAFSAQCTRAGTPVRSRAARPIREEVFLIRRYPDETRETGFPPEKSTTKMCAVVFHRPVRSANSCSYSALRMLN